MIKFHQNFFKESIPHEGVSPDHIRQSNFKFINIHDIQNKLTRFQIFQKRNLHVNTTNHFIKHNRNSCRIRTRF